MKTYERPRFLRPGMGIDGALLTFAPIPFLFIVTSENGAASQLWRVLCASGATACCILSAVMLFRRPRAAKVSGLVAMTGCFITGIPYFASNPFAALIGTVLLIGGMVELVDLKLTTSFNRKEDRKERWLQRSRWAAIAALIVLATTMVIGKPTSVISRYLPIISMGTAEVLFVHWVLRHTPKWYLMLPVTAFAAIAVMCLFAKTAWLPGGIVLFCCLNLLLLPRSGYTAQKHEAWWESIISQPGRVLLSTFLVLCVFGTMLLLLPFAGSRGVIDPVNAAFTSVSAVCVTGLVVLDTPTDFSLFGQGVILLLIQLGGLGIMTITTVAMHAMGHRFSLRHERVLTSIADTGHHDLFRSLIVILKFTAFAEGTGMVLLTVLFRTAGESWGASLWQALFTSVSAFCNAGFALQSDSLMLFSANTLILQVVSSLIIAGGMAPATCLFLPKWFIGREVPVSTRIALATTAVLLVSGTFLFLAFEWEGALAGMPIVDKVNNAWFQSVTLRTAGFNSVPIAQVADPTLLLMLIMMFIGGSPGGTAGGIKTTTVAVLAMTFWATITSRGDVIIRNRRILASTVYRAVTITFSGLLLWAIVVVMLEATQQIPAREIVFEATSALATVGLSIGATARLDEIGKIIIMIAMFAGRVGPMTLFMLLGINRPPVELQCPDAKINLT